MWKKRQNSPLTATGSILGILVLSVMAVIIVPHLAARADTGAKRDTKANLEVLRVAIDAYAAENRSTYPKGITLELVSSPDAVRYLRRIPEEMFTPSSLETPDPTPGSVITEEDVARSNVGGWMYNAAKGEVRLNRVGSDFEGEPYHRY